jgi:glutathione S-transferase
VLYGPAYSTYTRTARLALEEKGVAYDLREVDTLAGEGQRAEHLARHPWGKVPILEHDGFSCTRPSPSPATWTMRSPAPP